MATRPVPPPLGDINRENFETLRRAAINGDLALVSALRKRDKTPVALVCAINREGGMFIPVPLAVMIKGDPYKEFLPPGEGGELPEEGLVEERD